MSTERQIEANRQNALLSTGPQSDGGKARSSQNALTHGLTARSALLPGEDEAEFDALHQHMMWHYSASGPVETAVVERATFLIWRLRRIPLLEAALFQWMARLEGTNFAIEGFDGQQNSQCGTGRWLEAALSKDLLSKLSRYETNLVNQLKLSIGELRDMHRRHALYGFEDPRHDFEIL